MGVDVPLQGSFCHQKMHFSIQVGKRCRRSLAGAVFVTASCKGQFFGGFIRLIIIRLAGLIGLARVPDIRFGVRVRA